MSLVVTPEVIDAMISRAELRGDWDDVETMKVLRDRLLSLEAANQAYRHALANGVTINMVGKKRWLKHD